MKDLVGDSQGRYPRLTWIGHNVIGFDLLFLKQRCWINNIRPPFIIPADAKHGGDSVFDTMVEFAGSVSEAGHGWTDELSCTRKDGGVLPIEISASVIDIDGGSYLLAMVRDISKRRRAEHSLRALAVELAPRGITVNCVAPGWGA